MAQSFNKPATTLDQQVALLQKRGMVVDNITEAKFYLQHLNYYRLSAYWLSFEADHTTHQFKLGTQFKDVLNLYIFDRELRLLVLDCIERIEVSVRSQWAHQIGCTYGAHAHLNQSLFDSRYWHKNIKILTEEVSRSNEVFIQHLKENYCEALPPIWAVCEVMSLGTISKWYSSLKPKKIRSEISSIYGINETVLASWLRHVSVVRNICAHHSRLWNRKLTIIPELPKHKPSQLSGEFVADSRRIYNTLVILKYFMDIISPHHGWELRLKKIIDKHAIPVNEMGFPQNWEQRAIW